MIVNMLGQDEGPKQLPRRTGDSANQRQCKQLSISGCLTEAGNLDVHWPLHLSRCVLSSHQAKLIYALTISHCRNVSSLRGASVLILFSLISGPLFIIFLLYTLSATLPHQFLPASLEIYSVSHVHHLIVMAVMYRAYAPCHVLSMPHPIQSSLQLSKLVITISI